MKTDIDIFTITKWLMISTGTWELKLTEHSKIWQQIYQIYAKVIWVAYHASILSLIVRFFQLFKVDFEKAMECFAIFIVVFMMAVKMVLCRTKSMTKVIQNAVERNRVSLQTDDKNVHEIFSDYFKYAFRVNIFFSGLSYYVGICLTIFYPIYDYMEYKSHYQPGDKKPLQVEYWYPFDPQEYYLPMLIYQFFGVLFTNAYNNCVATLLNSLTVQIVAELRVMQYRFRTFAETRNGEHRSEEDAYFTLRACIQEHQKLIESVWGLRNALKPILFAEYLITALMFASTLVQILGGKKLFANCATITVLIGQFLILSWNANEILLQSEGISMALYESDWYKQSKRTNQLIFLLMLRADKPLFLQIGPLGALTIDSAISRLKLAYSYISVIS